MSWILKYKKMPGEIWSSLLNRKTNSAGRFGDFAKKKNISHGKRKEALFVALFIVFGVFVFNIGDASAGTCQCLNMNGLGTGLVGFDNRTPVGSQFNTDSNSACETACVGKSERYCYTDLPGACVIDQAVAPGGVAASVVANGNQAKKVVMDEATSAFVKATKLLLVGILNLVGWIFAVAATLFSWAIEPANISGSNGMLNKQAVMDVWIMVRDTLNMTFILILLFAAFCTIFQVEKWNLKKVWLAILINALLVNFSYPIARFFIDVSNVAFYYFVNHLFTTSTSINGDSIFASFGAAAKLGPILSPGNYAQYDIAYLVAMIVFAFIMGMTLLIIAALFVVRLIALTMLVMFSPIGFVGYIFPSTSSYADKWWSNLFSYSFFAPIMIFVMAIAIRVSQAMGTENFQSFKSHAADNATASDANWISQASFFIIPILIMWAGIGVAKSSGIAGADAIVGAVKKGGKWLANIPWAGAKMAGRATGIPGGFKQAKDYYGKRGVKFPGFKNRHFGSDQTEATNNWWAEKVGRVPNAMDSNTLKKMGEAAKDLNIEDMTPAQLNKIAERGSSYERLAAIEQLAKSGDISRMQLDGVMAAYGEGSAIRKRILGKVKETRPDLAFNHISDLGERENEMRKFINSDKCDVKKFGRQTLQNADFMGAVIAEGKIDPKALEALNAKDKRSGDIIKQTVSDVASLYNPGNVNMQNANTRNIMMAFTNTTGNIHGSLAGPGMVAQRMEIFKRLNKDVAANMTLNTVRSYADEIGHNLDSGKIVDVVKGMKDKQAKQTLVRAIVGLAGVVPPDANIMELEKVISNDSYLKSLI